MGLALFAAMLLLVVALFGPETVSPRAHVADAPHADRSARPAPAVPRGDTDSGDPRPSERAPSEPAPEVPASSECPETAEPLPVATPTADWHEAGVTHALTMLHAPGWTVEQHVEGTSAISPSDNPVGLIVVPYLDSAVTSGEALEIAGLLLGGYGPDYEVTSIGATTLAGRPACRGIATSPDLGATVEFTVTADGGGGMLAVIVTFDDSDPDEIAEARATVDSLNWTGTAA
jgi:hypothetical protein